MRLCPDGASCRHDCVNPSYCWRRDTGKCLPLKSSGFSDDWVAPTWLDTVERLAKQASEPHASPHENCYTCDAIGALFEDELDADGVVALVACVRAAQWMRDHDLPEARAAFDTALAGLPKGAPSGW